ncbi:MAG: hypothetical protein Athens071416_15 [Parcubacteria group bacterium Athens0714_16]|nr:MAG: hypothetical protein Athens071416_15 [Parcubacteria group bacterium Athens0714_16]
MNTEQKKISLINYFSKNVAVVIGLVLVWRGVWYILDSFDSFFNINPLYSGIVGIVIGLLVLYIPDKDLKEIGKL